MPDWKALGRTILAIAILLFATLHLMRALSLGPAVTFPWIATSKLVIAITGILLLACGIGILIDRCRRLASLVLAVFLAIYVLAFYITFIAQGPRDPTRYAGVAELISMASAALLLSDDSRPFSLTARILLALAMVNFGAVHFLLPQFIGPLVPAWLPGHLFFTYFIGCAFIAAALSFVSGIQVRLAGILLGFMFVIFVVTLHLPRILHALRSMDEWISGAVAFAMIGVSWIASDSASAARKAVAKSVS